MELDSFNRPFFTEDEIIEQLYKDPASDIAEIRITNGAAQIFNQAIHALFLEDPIIRHPASRATSPAEFDQINQETWHMPAEYRTLDVYSYVISLCVTQDEVTRAFEELEQFDARNMMPLLQYMKYLVDTMRKHKIVWGVGRGSSVSSFVLYKIGIHRIDSLRYNLDWREFLR